MKAEFIQRKLKTIEDKYGSLDNMNKIIFQKRKKEIIGNLRRDGIQEEILEYSYDKLGFVRCKGKCGHEYDISMQLLRNRHYANHKLCTICNTNIGKNSSQAEIELFEWLSKFIKCERNVRDQIKGEIDIFVPSKKLGIEYNGIFWHSDLYKDRNYHINKSLLAEANGIDLIHVWEDLWNNKKEIVKGRILSRLNLNQEKIGARKTKFVEINSSDARIFSDANHLQGFRPAYKHYGLQYKEKLVYYISISKRKIGKSKSSSMEILRSCSLLGYNIQGGFSKLFKHIKEENEATWVTYADLSWGKGGVYSKAGFELKGFSTPSYWYFINSQRFHRYTYRKSELVKMGYDPNKTEIQIMNEDIKALRVYDCGNAVWRIDQI
ncbi:MAG: hypothetical protein HC831_13460 [Chloroflexia bacterium]|nr:hypothetical protein [Chloroflexia bacterium]